MNYVQQVIETLNVRLPGLPPELIDLYTNLVFSRGAKTSLEDVHDAWAIWKNRIKPDHKSLIPFEDLSPEVQELDRKYMMAIRNTALDQVFGR